MSTIPEGVKQPEDRKSAAQREAEGVESITIDFDGHEFTFPADPLDWPTRAMEAFEDGKAIRAIKSLIGEKRYERLGIGDWSLRKTNDLFEQFAKRAGLTDTGE